MALKRYLLEEKKYYLVFFEPTRAGRATLLQHVEKLGFCDACLIFYDRNAPKWLQQKLNDLRKYLFVRPRRVFATAIYMTRDAPSETSADGLAMVLRTDGPFAPSQLQRFVDRIDEAARQ